MAMQLAEQVADQLIVLLNDERESVPIRAAAAEALGTSDGPSSLAALREAADVPNRSVREAVQASLATRKAAVGREAVSAVGGGRAP